MGPLLAFGKPGPTPTEFRRFFKEDVGTGPSVFRRLLLGVCNRVERRVSMVVCTSEREKGVIHTIRSIVGVILLFEGALEKVRRFRSYSSPGATYFTSQTTKYQVCYGT